MAFVFSPCWQSRSASWQAAYLPWILKRPSRSLSIRVGGERVVLMRSIRSLKQRMGISGLTPELDYGDLTELLLHGGRQIQAIQICQGMRCQCWEAKMAVFGLVVQMACCS